MEKQRPERRLQTSSIIIDNKNVDFVFLFPYYTIVGPGVSVFLDEKKIVFNPPSGSKEEILRFLLEKGGVGERENILEKLMVRENLESTGIGNGIAIPHARCDDVDELTVICGISRDGIDFDALDGKPVYVIFLIVSPDKNKSLYLRVLANISRLLRHTPVRDELIRARNPKEAIEIIKKYEPV